MCDFIMTDAEGRQLVLTTNIDRNSFDTVTCSPNMGLTVLNGLLGDFNSRDQLAEVCRTTVERNEVCILPDDFHPEWRILLTPNVSARGEAGRDEACRLMVDLFTAWKSLGKDYKTLLITHFGCVRDYPESHIVGIFSALEKLRQRSFCNLKVLGFEIAPQHKQRFDEHARAVLSI
jgi:hypothetical protein